MSMLVDHRRHNELVENVYTTNVILFNSIRELINDVKQIRDQLKDLKKDAESLQSRVEALENMCRLDEVLADTIDHDSEYY